MNRAELDSSVSDVLRLYDYSHNQWANSEALSLDCHKFYIGEQWDAGEQRYLAKQDRVAMVYNMILPRVNNLIGTEQLNRKSIKVLPYKGEHREISGVINSLIWNNWVNGEFEYYLQEAFKGGLICTKGGWVKIYVTLDGSMQPVYGLRNADAFSVYPDPDYKDYKMTDCNWVIEERWLTLDEIIEVYGSNDAYETERRIGFMRSIVEKVSGYFKPDDLSEFYNKEGEKYKILEVQQRKTRAASLLLNRSTGMKVSVLKGEVEDYVGSGDYVWLDDVRSKYIHLKTVFPYYNLMLLDEAHVLDTDMYDLINYYSIDVNHRKCNNSSLVQQLRDVQKNMNKREVQKTAMLDHALNSPLFFSYEDKEGRDEYELRGNKPGLGFLYRSNRNPPYRLPAAQMPNGAWTDIADSEAKMNDISAVNNAMRGNSDYSNESNALMQTKLSRVAASVNPYFNNLSMTRKMVGEYILKTLSRVYGQEDRTVNVTDRIGKTWQVILNERDILSGDTYNDVRNFEGMVVLDEAEYSPTKRDESFQTKLALLQILGAQFIDIEWLLKDSDLPDVEQQIEYWKKMMGMQADAGARQQALAEQAEILNQLKQEQELVGNGESKRRNDVNKKQ